MFLDLIKRVPSRKRWTPQPYRHQFLVPDKSSGECTIFDVSSTGEFCHRSFEAYMMTAGDRCDWLMSRQTMPESLPQLRRYSL